MLMVIIKVKTLAKTAMATKDQTTAIQEQIIIIGEPVATTEIKWSAMLNPGIEATQTKSGEAPQNLKENRMAEESKMEDKNKMADVNIMWSRNKMADKIKMADENKMVEEIGVLRETAKTALRVPKDAQEEIYRPVTKGAQKTLAPG